MAKKTNLTKDELKESYRKLGELIDQYLADSRELHDCEWQPVLDNINDALNRAEDQLRAVGLLPGNFD